MYASAVGLVVLVPLAPAPWMVDVTIRTTVALVFVLTASVKAVYVTVGPVRRFRVPKSFLSRPHAYSKPPLAVNTADSPFRSVTDDGEIETGESADSVSQPVSNASMAASAKHPLNIRFFFIMIQPYPRA